MAVPTSGIELAFSRWQGKNVMLAPLGMSGDSVILCLHSSVGVRDASRLFCIHTTNVVRLYVSQSTSECCWRIAEFTPVLSAVHLPSDQTLMPDLGYYRVSSSHFYLLDIDRKPTPCSVAAHPNFSVTTEIECCLWNVHASSENAKRSCATAFNSCHL